MSVGNRRSDRQTRRHLCAACRERRARYRYHGVVRADRQHVLCFQCFRSARERLRARQTRQGPDVPPPWVVGLDVARPTPHDHPVLSERQIEHRQAMLAHLARTENQSRAG